ncbi:hypothetical protein RISK_006083 [Rhodopirellula islandica]|uniref:ASPIC/UnbV domain-containing protein n=1 Tax=Rhodopirellula islandica TaxID=595434 RepID=A0A0J1E8W0_RHOIS|nr:FG-GAP-like repeat-containing protein [Rhodopirellula islandica]KLU01899.1 hypothetical protein RISK_006083 [Rhodopirellula islandica]
MPRTRIVIDAVGSCLLCCLLSGCNGSDDASPKAAPSPPAENHAASVDSPQASNTHYQEAIQSVRRGDFRSAERALRDHLLANPTDELAMELAGDVSARTGDIAQSIQWYRDAVEQTAVPSDALLNKLAKHLMANGLAYDSVEVLKQMISTYPELERPRYDLAGLVTVLGLNREAIGPLQWLIQHNLSDEESLVVLSNPDRVQPDPEFCHKLLSRAPEDLRPHFALAKLDAAKQDWLAVTQQLTPVLQQHPDFLPAWALQGQALVSLAVANPDVAESRSNLLQWSQTKPPGLETLPEYWNAAGMWAKFTGENASAVRSFTEAARLHQSNHGPSLADLQASLRQYGREAEAEQVARRFDHIAGLNDAVKTFLERNSQSQLAALKVAYRMIDLGRIWEAEAWTRLAKSLTQDPVPSIEQAHLAIRSRLRADTPWQSQSSLVADSIQVSDLPTVSWNASSNRVREIANQIDVAPLQFLEQAAELGLKHTVSLAPEAESEGHWIYQSTGGGAAVLDFDLNGWPDVALANLDGKPLLKNSSPNQLFRNLEGHFQNTTAPSKYLDTGFAQGITSGDFNDDGFPDLFDANVGRNRLYRNNGDGTFSDATDDVGLVGSEWTTSAVIADVNGDGNADLFEVNYCGGMAPYETPCRSEANGKLSSCPPLKFEASPDHIWSGDGKGGFQNASRQWMQPTSIGRGLGIIAGQLDELPGLDLFIANDMSVNHLWSSSHSAHTNERTSPEQTTRLTDIGTVRGLAMSGQSNSQASMGMAVGDPDGDGDLDFFLTHFAEEHNTYYEQVAPGLWEDRTHAVGLYEPSLDQLGFGATWTDFNLDGATELLITNGHVSDTGRTDIGYQMPPQLFTRLGSGRWEEIPNDSLGSYFEQSHLGRALVTLDANNDGRTDALITHLYEPVALLINESMPACESTGLEFKATTGHRDAIGTTVEVRNPNDQRTLQLTAGDGYMSSQERKLNLPIPSGNTSSDIQVHWPSGLSQLFRGLDAGQDYLLVEGIEKPIPTKKHVR